MNYEPVSGSERGLRSAGSVLGRANPNREIRVTMQLKSSKDPTNARLKEFLWGSSGPEQAQSRSLSLGLLHNSAKDRKYLTREEFAASFGVSPADVLRAKAFAREFGLHVVRDTVAEKTKANPLGQRTVELRGPISAFNSAFNVQILMARDTNGRLHRMVDGPISVPAKYQDLIENVLGFDNSRQASPRLRPLKRLGGLTRRGGSVSYSPNQVARLYNFPTSVTGKGQTIAVIELGGGARRRDLKKYFASLRIPEPSVKFVSVGSGSNAPTGNPDGDDGEVMLDIEVAGAVAPGAQIIVYFAANTNKGFLRGINAAIHDNLHQPSIISISWGSPEASYSASDLTTFDESFQAAAAMGITTFLAAGDSGLTDGVTDSLAHVDFPASSPHVTSCGGTRLVTTADGSSVLTESVWNDGEEGGGTGGGISSFFPLPIYQQGLGIQQSINPGGGPGRGVPDVAGNADPITGYRVRVDHVASVFGGTSAVAPLWAGLFALINESLGKNVGFANTLLYTNSVTKTPGAFRDVTQGNNDTTGQFGGYYKALTGWDPCTGWGTPNGTILRNAIQLA
jgi:kumamolisin